MSARIWKYRRNKKRSRNYGVLPIGKLLGVRAYGGDPPVRIPGLDAMMEKIWNNWSPEPQVFNFEGPATIG